MTKKEAQKLAKEIGKGGHEVTSFRHWGRGRWEIVVKDPLTGYTCVISSRADWEERVGPAH